MVVHLKLRPHGKKHPQSETFADERLKEAKQLSDNCAPSLGQILRLQLSPGFVRTGQRAIRSDLHGTEPRNLRPRQGERPRKQRVKSSGAHEGREMRTQLLTDPIGGGIIRPRGIGLRSLHSHEPRRNVPHLLGGPAHREFRKSLSPALEMRNW